MADDSPKPQPLDHATPPGRRARWQIIVLAVVICAAIAYLFLGWVVYRPMRYRSSRIPCVSHMRQLGVAMLIYAQEHEGNFPDRLETLLLTEPSLEPKTFLCPSSTDTPVEGATRQEQADNLSAGGHCSFIYIGRGLTTAASSDVPVLYEPLSNHNGDGSNVLYADGHVTFVLPQQLARELATTRPTTAPATREAK